MILISHRGNIDGPNLENENSPKYIENALSLGYDVEIDVWFIGNKFFLGHDKPQYEIGYNFLINDKLWCHGKNVDSIVEMEKYPIHYFWHENDTITLTSKNFIWSFPNKNPIKNSIVVLPELFDTELNYPKGVCSDFIKNYI